MVTDRELPLGSLVDIDLMLPESEQALAISGRVVHVEKKGEGRFETAARIMDIPTADRALLTSYLLSG